MGGKQGITQRREGFGFFPSHLEMVPRATPKTRWAARRLSRSVATARSTSALRSRTVSQLLGVSTRLWDCWWPQTLWPFLTMRSLPHAVQRGAVFYANDNFPAIARHGDEGSFVFN